MSDGGSDELVALGAILGDTALADAHLARALRHVRAVSPPEELEKNLNSVRSLVALANGRDEEAYTLASAASTQPSRDQRNAMFVAGLAAYA